MGVDMSWMLGCSTVLKMNLLYPEPELWIFFWLSDKAEVPLGGLDLCIEELHKILFCLMVQLMKSHLIIAPKSWWTACACMQFPLCFLGIGLVSCMSHMQQLWICKELG